jgi:hypothetical protein
VSHGVSAQQFRRHYAPLCREIERDNRAGRFLFRFAQVFQHHRWLTLPHLRSLIEEQALAPEKRRHSRLLWGMFTGAYPYRRLLAMAVHPSLQLQLLRGLAHEVRAARSSR